MGHCIRGPVVVRNARIDATHTVLDLRGLCNTTVMTMNFENVTFTGYVTVRYAASHDVVMTRCTFNGNRMEAYINDHHPTTPGLHQLTFEGDGVVALQSFSMLHSSTSLLCVSRCFHMVLPIVRVGVWVENTTMTWRSAWSAPRAFANETSFDAMSGGVHALVNQRDPANYSVVGCSMLVRGFGSRQDLYEYQGVALLFLERVLPIFSVEYVNHNITMENNALTVDRTARFPKLETPMPALPPVALLRCVDVAGGTLRLTGNRMDALALSAPSYGGILHFRVSTAFIEALVTAGSGANGLPIGGYGLSAAIHRNTVRIATHEDMGGIVSQEPLGPLGHGLCAMLVSSSVWALNATRAMYHSVLANISDNDVVHTRHDLFAEANNVDNVLLALPPAATTTVVVHNNTMGIASTAIRDISSGGVELHPQEVFAHNVMVLLANTSGYEANAVAVDVRIQNNALSVEHMVPSSAVVVAGQSTTPIPAYPLFGQADAFATNLGSTSAYIAVQHNAINLTVRFVEGAVTTDKLVGVIAWFGCGSLCIDSAVDTDLPSNLTVLVARNALSIVNLARPVSLDDGLVGIGMDTTYSAFRHLSSHAVVGNTIYYTAFNGNTTDVFVGILYRDRVRVVDPMLDTAINVSGNTMVLACLNQSNMVVESSTLYGIAVKSLAVEQWSLETQASTATPVVSIGLNNITWETSFAEDSALQPPATTVFEGIAVGYVALFETKYLEIAHNSIALLGGYFFQFKGIRVTEVAASPYQQDVLRVHANRVVTASSSESGRVALHTDWATVRGIQIERISGTVAPPHVGQVAGPSPVAVVGNEVRIALEPFGLATFNDSYALLTRPTCAVSDVRVAWDGVDAAIGAVVITTFVGRRGCTSVEFNTSSSGCTYLHVSERGDGDNGRYVAFGRRFDGSYQQPVVAAGSTIYAVALHAADGAPWLLDPMPPTVTVVSTCAQMGSLPNPSAAPWAKTDSVEVTAYYMGPTQAETPSMNYTTVDFRNNTALIRVENMRRQLERAAAILTALHVVMGDQSILIVSQLTATVDGGFAKAAGLRVQGASTVSLNASTVSVSAGWKFVVDATYALDVFSMQYTPARGIGCDAPNVVLTVVGTNVTAVGWYGGTVMGIAQTSAGPATLNITRSTITVTVFGSFGVGVNFANDRAANLLAFVPNPARLAAFAMRNATVTVVAQALPANRAAIAVRLHGGQQEYLTAQLLDNTIAVLLRDASSGQRVEGIEVTGWFVGANLVMVRSTVNITGRNVGAPLALGPEAPTTYAGILLTLLMATGSSIGRGASGGWLLEDNTIHIQIDRLQSASDVTGIGIVDANVRTVANHLAIRGGSITVASQTDASPYDAGAARSIAMGLLLQDIASPSGASLAIERVHVSLHAFASIRNRAIHLRNVSLADGHGTTLTITNCKAVGYGLGTGSVALAVNLTSAANLEITDSTFDMHIGHPSPFALEPSESGDAVAISQSRAAVIVVRNASITTTCRSQGLQATSALNIVQTTVFKEVLVSGVAMTVFAETAAAFLSVNNTIKGITFVDCAIHANPNATVYDASVTNTTSSYGQTGAVGVDVWRSDVRTVALRNVTSTVSCLDGCHCANVLVAGKVVAEAAVFPSTHIDVHGSTFVVASRITTPPTAAALRDAATDPAASSNAHRCAHAGVSIANTTAPVTLSVDDTAIATDRGSAVVVVNASHAFAVSLHKTSLAPQRAAVQLVAAMSASVVVSSSTMQPSRDAVRWLPDDACAVVSAHNAYLTSVRIEDISIKFTSTPAPAARNFHWLHLDSRSRLDGGTNPAAQLVRSSSTFAPTVVLTVPPYYNPAAVAAPYPTVAVSDLNLHGGAVNASDSGPINRFYATEALIAPVVSCVWYDMVLMEVDNISKTGVPAPGLGWSNTTVNNTECVAPTTTTTTTAAPTTTAAAPTTTTAAPTTTLLPLSSPTPIPPPPPSTTQDACQLNASVAVWGMVHTTRLNTTSFEAVTPLPDTVSPSMVGTSVSASGDVLDASGRYVLVRLFLDNASSEAAAVAAFGGGGGGSWTTGLMQLVSASSRQLPSGSAIDLVLYANPTDVPLVADTTHALLLKSPASCGPQHPLVSAAVVVTRKSTVIPPAVIDDVTTTTGAVVAVATLLGGSSVTAGISTARFKAYMALSGCDFDHTVGLDFVTSPSQLCFGDAVGRCYRGGVVGSLSILVGCGLLVSAVGIAATWVRGRRRGASGSGKHTPTWMDIVRDGMLLVHFPSVLFVPFTVVVEGLAVTSTAVVVHAQGAGDYLVGAVGFATIAVMLSYGWHTIRAFCCVLVPRIGPPPLPATEDGGTGHEDDVPTPPPAAAAAAAAAPRSKAMQFFRSDVKWSVANRGSFKKPNAPNAPVTDHLYKEKHLHLFNDYRVAYYPLLETTVTAVFGVFDGIRLTNNDAACMTSILCVCILTFVLCAVALWLRPALVMVEAVFMYALNAVACIAAVVLLVGTVMEDEGVLAGSDVLSLVGMLLNAIKVLSSLIAVLVWLCGSGQHLSFSNWMRQRFQHLTASKAKDTAGVAPTHASTPSQPLFQMEGIDSNNDAFEGTVDALTFARAATASTPMSSSMPPQVVAPQADVGDDDTFSEATNTSPKVDPQPDPEHRLAGAHHMEDLYNEIHQGLRGERRVATMLGRRASVALPNSIAAGQPHHRRGVPQMGDSFTDATFDLLKRQQQERDGHHGQHDSPGDDAFGSSMLGRTPSRLRISHTTTTTIELDLI